MFHQTPAKTATGLLTIAGLALYALFGGFFDREIVIEIAVLAMVAISLDVVAGYGGMISLCHGAIFGLGAYGYATMTALLGMPTSLATLVGIAVAALFGLIVGAVTSNTAGIFFIMATLAFGQLAYVLVFESPALGGDDGMSGVLRIDLSWLGLDMMDSLQFALVCLVALCVVYALAAMVLRASFGRTLCGIHANEARMRAIGVTVWQHKALAFAFSAALAGAAGTLAAQQTQFVSPLLLVWTLSGEVLIVVILGGIGTLVGPVIGAVLLVLLKHEISEYTDYWHLWVGLALIVTVMSGGRGLYGSLEPLLDRLTGRPTAHAAGVAGGGPSGA